MNTSGIIEVRGEREILLDDIMLAADEMDEKRRSERDERTGLDERLRVSGEKIRDQAMNRRESSSEATTPRKRQCTGDSDDEDSERMEQHILRQHDSTEKRFKIDEDRLQLEKRKEEREMAREKVDMERASRMERLEIQQFELDTKRLDMDRARLELETEKRKAGIEERRQTNIAFAAIAKKLL